MLGAEADDHMKIIIEYGKSMIEIMTIDEEIPGNNKEQADNKRMEEWTIDNNRWGRKDHKKN